MEQKVLAILVVLVALFFVGRRLVLFFRPGQAPSCDMGCSGCNSSSTCAKPQKETEK